MKKIIKRIFSMEKRNRIILAILIVIIIFLINYLLIIGMQSIKHSNAWNIRNSWDVDLPDEDVEKRYIERAGWNGDGEYYYILEYNTKEKIEKLKKNIQWKDEKNEEIEKSVNTVLKKLNVSKDIFPDYDNYQYLYRVRHDNSKLYIIYKQIGERVILYVIKDIY